MHSQTVAFLCLQPIPDQYGRNDVTKNFSVGRYKNIYTYDDKQNTYICTTPSSYAFLQDTWCQNFLNSKYTIYDVSAYAVKTTQGLRNFQVFLKLRKFKFLEDVDSADLHPLVTPFIPHHKDKFSQSFKNKYARIDRLVRCHVSKLSITKFSLLKDVS